MVTNECALYVALEMARIRFIISRLHDATGCQTGCTTGLTTVLNEQPLFVQPGWTSSHCSCNRLCRVYKHLQAVWQQVVSCKRGLWFCAAVHDVLYILALIDSRNHARFCHRIPNVITAWASEQTSSRKSFEPSSLTSGLKSVEASRKQVLSPK